MLAYQDTGEFPVDPPNVFENIPSLLEFFSLFYMLGHSEFSRTQRAFQGGRLLPAPSFNRIPIHTNVSQKHIECKSSLCFRYQKCITKKGDTGYVEELIEGLVNGCLLTLSFLSFSQREKVSSKNRRI